MSRSNRLKGHYPNLGELQIEKILESYDNGHTWFDYCPETHEVTMVTDGGGIDISVVGEVTPTSNPFTELRG